MNGPSYPLTVQVILETLVGGSKVYTSTLSGSCTANGPGTSSITNSGGAFSGPGLPEKHDLRLVTRDVNVLSEPRGKPTGGVLKACQTVFTIDTSKDGKYYQVFVMGGWIPVDATADVAENYGQPGGQPIVPQCVGK
jgi:hypothetical protein